MRIYLATAPFESELHQSTADYLNQLERPEDLTVFSEHRPGISVAESVLNIADSDGLIARFEEVDTELSKKVMLAHNLGKSVLVGLRQGMKPELILPAFGEAPQHNTEKRKSHSYYVFAREQRTHDVKIVTRGLSRLQLQVWVEAQYIEYRRKHKIEPPTDAFTVELADQSKHDS